MGTRRIDRCRNWLVDISPHHVPLNKVDISTYEHNVDISPPRTNEQTYLPIQPNVRPGGVRTAAFAIGRS